MKKEKEKVHHGPFGLLSAVVSGASIADPVESKSTPESSKTSPVNLYHDNVEPNISEVSSNAVIGKMDEKRQTRSMTKNNAMKTPLSDEPKTDYIHARNSTSTRAHSEPDPSCEPFTIDLHDTNKAQNEGTPPQ